jgi:hypothetical protein
MNPDDRVNCDMNFLLQGWPTNETAVEEKKLTRSLEAVNKIYKTHFARTTKNARQFFGPFADLS